MIWLVIAAVVGFICAETGFGSTIPLPLAIVGLVVSGAVLMKLDR